MTGFSRRPKGDKRFLTLPRPFISIDTPTSSRFTQKRLGWHPTQPGLIPDLDSVSGSSRAAAMRGGYATGQALIVDAGRMLN